MRQLLLASCVALLLILAALVRVGGASFLAEVRDDEVGVVLDGWDGRARALELPGWVPHLPFLQDVYRLRRSPLELVLSGAEEALDPADPFRRARLAVRARDGSSYALEKVRIHFALDPARAVIVLQDLGADPRRWARLVHVHASAILGDEFARYGTEEIVLPANMEAAARQAEERLSRALAPHGLRLVALSAPEPSFDRDWERAVERRKVHDQQAAYLAARLEELDASRERRLAETHTEVELALHEWRARLALEERAVARELFVARAEAESAYERRVAEGRAQLEAARARAEGLALRLEPEVQAFARELELLELAGLAAVRKALVERLERTSFVLEPYARDASPERIETVTTKP